MADIFDEVQEDLRRDRLKKVWDRFAPVIIGVAVLIVVGIGGWRLYQYFQAERAAADGARYIAAMNLSSEGKNAEAAAAFAALAQDGTAGYRTVARLRAAAELAGTDAKAGIAAYDAYAGDNAEPSGLRDVARLRSGYLIVDNGTYAEARQRVEQLAVPDNPFRHGAREVLGLSAFRSGEWAEARRWFEALVADANAPPSARQRADLVLDVIGSADKPPPVAAPPPAAPPIDIFAPPVGGAPMLPSLTTPIIPALPSPETSPSFEPPPATPPAGADPAVTPAPATPEAATPPAPAVSAPDSASPPAPAPEAVTPPAPPPEVPQAVPPAPEAAPANPPAAAPEAPSPPAADSPPAAPETPAAPPAAAPPAAEPAPAMPQSAPDGATPPANSGAATDTATPPPASSSESPR